MERQPSFDLQKETVDGGLKELVMRWFTETQAPLIQRSNGSFPEWFQGFATRRDTEDLLRDKALGCFLIRLSDKAVGYILSYKGQDRCRHFVITQNPDGLFMITGDSQPYHSLTELIEHYRISPIQPFGEYLTSSCHEVDTNELYDVVKFDSKAKSGVSVQALRSLWDQKKDRPREPAGVPNAQQRQEPPTVPPPSLPPKKQSKDKKLTGTVSVDSTSLSQVPPVPKRGFPTGFYLSESLPETTTHPNETQMESGKNQNPTSRNSVYTVHPPDFSNPELIQVEARSKSLPELDSQEEYSNKLSSSSFTSTNSPSPVKRVTCHTYSLHEPTAQRLEGSSTEQERAELEMLKSNPLYQTSEEQGKRSGQKADGMYAELSKLSTPEAPTDDTYEPIQGESPAFDPGNTYESLDGMKLRKPKSTWGKSNIKWKKFLPDYMKK